MERDQSESATQQNSGDKVGIFVTWLFAMLLAAVGLRLYGFAGGTLGFAAFAVYAAQKWHHGGDAVDR